MAEKRSNTFRVQVVGGKGFQEIYRKLNLSAGDPVELLPKKSENKIYVAYKKKGFFSSSSENLGYLYKSNDLLEQLDAGHQILNPTVAGYYNDDEGGKKLILQITVEYEFDPDSEYWQKRRW